MLYAVKDVTTVLLLLLYLLHVMLYPCILVRLRKVKVA